jgi:putative flippase GtrA
VLDSIENGKVKRQPMATEASGFRTALRESLRLVRFGFVGASVAACYAAITFSIVRSGLGGPMTATIFGHIIAAILSYFGHMYFSFAVNPDHRIFLGRFAVVAGLTFALNVALTWLLTSVFRTPYQVPILVVTIAIPAANYVLNRFWVFSPGLSTSR